MNAAAVLTALHSYTHNPAANAQKLRGLLEDDVSGFLDCIGQEEEDGDRGNRGLRYSLLLLRNAGALIPYLANPKRSSFEQALRFTKIMLSVEPEFGDSLLREVASDAPTLEGIASEVRSKQLRHLDLVLDSGAAITSWHLVTRFLETVEHGLKARCIKLMSRHRLDGTRVQSIFEHGDARSRADLVEMLAAEAYPHLDRIVLQAVEDGNGRVSANACLAAYRLNDERSLRWLASLIGTDRRTAVRISAAWAIGQTRDVRFTGILRESWRSENPQLRAASLKALTRLGRIDRSAVDPDLRIETVVAFDSSRTKAAERRTLYVSLGGPGADPPSKVNAIDFMLFRDYVPILEYSARKPEPGSVPVRIACPASLLDGLAAVLKNEPAGTVESLTVYGANAADQQEGTEVGISNSIVWAESLDKALETFLVPIGRSSVNLLVISPEDGYSVDLAQMEEACEARGSTLHVVEVSSKADPTSRLRQMPPEDLNQFWQGFLHGVARGWTIVVPGPRGTFSVRIRHKNKEKTRFSEEAVC